MLKHCVKNFKHVVPQVQIAMVISICKLLENILANNDVKNLDPVFVFACIWCIGGGYIEKEGRDFKKDFSGYCKEFFKHHRFKGSVFEFFVDIENSKFEEWSGGKMKVPDV